MQQDQDRLSIEEIARQLRQIAPTLSQRSRCGRRRCADRRRGELERPCATYPYHSEHEFITLHDLTALNDDTVALVRAGVPVWKTDRRGLRTDVPGRLGTLNAGSGRRHPPRPSLGEVSADPEVRLPKVYRAVVERGWAGRLPAALESVAGSVRAW